MALYCFFFIFYFLFFQADLLTLSAIVKLLDRFVVLVSRQRHGVFLFFFFLMIDFEEVSRRVKTFMSTATIAHNLPIAEALVNTKPKGLVKIQ